MVGDISRKRCRVGRAGILWTAIVSDDTDAVLHAGDVFIMLSSASVMSQRSVVWRGSPVP